MKRFLVLLTSLYLSCFAVDLAIGQRLSLAELNARLSTVEGLESQVATLQSQVLDLENENAGLQNLINNQQAIIEDLQFRSAICNSTGSADLNANTAWQTDNVSFMGSALVDFRTLTFTKLQDKSRLRVSWKDQIAVRSTESQVLQFTWDFLLDGQFAGSAFFSEVPSSVFQFRPVSAVVVLDDIPAGEHTISFRVRNVAPPAVIDFAAATNSWELKVEETRLALPTDK